uniref:Uncharacterized protein n=1 Tax=Megaselia scalaris TaxID=36166 RepID=T1GNE7_MEGSC
MENIRINRDGKCLQFMEIMDKQHRHCCSLHKTLFEWDSNYLTKYIDKNKLIMNQGWTLSQYGLSYISNMNNIDNYGLLKKNIDPKLLQSSSSCQ